MTFTIIGRRWFEKTNGNTYHSVEVYRDGDLIEKMPFAYGYGSQFEQSAMDIIEKHHPRIVDNAKRRRSQGRYSTLENYKELYLAPHSLNYYSPHRVVVSVTDVSRKKDL